MKRLASHRDLAALAIAIALAVGFFAWRCWPASVFGTADPDDGEGDRCGFGIVAETADPDALVATPGALEPGQYFDVRRADGRVSDLGDLLLHGDEESGCLTYSLIAGGSGPTWIDVTGQTQIFTVREVEPPIRTVEHVVPETAGVGQYLACAVYEDRGPECAEVTVSR
ncbi:hypothetical protein GUY44_17230 [Pimelobacter simplex]|uniref:Uncharacterized protein n=1 Tax=Nocardioides simplex TaxID=2045 RepID=A0A0A1DMQ8_NOCSI|nr:hypothetical protein [Pimelobacter simplex]AIY18686.1 hypothetical protein KR76_21380 [Pimelobacter simplex]MCG8152235.1 hypothetical protein [Pimelobacter simplex]GEB14350.1 hypothetical protein NSI01_26650 [Pimelobacter simplex]SFM30737.1 hypothetical protein SAMN05421671_1069 [Pimelobacter simplex]